MTKTKILPILTILFILFVIGVVMIVARSDKNETNKDTTDLTSFVRINAGDKFTIEDGFQRTKDIEVVPGQEYNSIKIYKDNSIIIENICFEFTDREIDFVKPSIESNGNRLYSVIDVPMEMFVLLPLGTSDIDCYNLNKSTSVFEFDFRMESSNQALSDATIYIREYPGE